MSRGSRRAGCLAVVLAMAASVAGGALPVRAAVTAGTNGTIAVAGGTGLFSINPVGGARTAIGGTGSSDSEPEVAPTASRVAYSSAGNLAVADYPSGNNRTTLVSGGAFSPGWSPDSSKITYECTRAICVVPAAGGSPTALTDVLDDHQPDFSPDGQQIVFARFTQGIMKVASSLSGSASLVPGTAAGDTSPVLSPDGSRVYFTCTAAPGPGICHMPFPNGGNRTLLAGTTGSDGNPFPSPDGATVGFDSGGGLFTVAAGGGSRTAIAGSVIGDVHGSWAKVAGSGPPVPPTGGGANTPPVFAASSTCGGTAMLSLIGLFTGSSGAKVSASDSTGQSVTLTATGLPFLAVFSTTPGNPATGTISIGFDFGGIINLLLGVLANPTKLLDQLTQILTNPGQLLDALLGLITGAGTPVTITATDNGSPPATATCALTVRIGLI